MHLTTPRERCASRVRHVLVKYGTGVYQIAALVRQGSLNRCVDVHVHLSMSGNGPSKILILCVKCMVRHFYEAGGAS